MAGQVKFVLDADAGKAVSAFLKIVDAQKKIEGGHREIIKGGKDVEGMCDSIKGAAHEMIAEFASFEMVKTIWENTSEEIHHAYEELVLFNRESKGLTSLGGNIDNIPGARDRAVALSDEFGIHLKELLPWLTNVEIKTSDLPVNQKTEYERGALETFEATGQQPRDTFEAARTLRENFPGLKIPEAYNAVEFLRQKGGMAAEEQAGFLPTIAPAFKDLGINLKDFEAVISTITRSGGKDSTIGKGLIEGLNKLPEMVEQGHIRANAGWAGVLEDIQKFHDADLGEYQKEAGKRGGPALFAMATHRDVYDQALTAEAGFPANAIALIRQKQTADEQTSMGMRAEHEEVIKENQPYKMSATEAHYVSEWNTRELGAELKMPVGLKWIAPLLAGEEKAFSYLGLSEKALKKGVESTDQVSQFLDSNPEVDEIISRENFARTSSDNPNDPKFADRYFAAHPNPLNAVAREVDIANSNSGGGVDAWFPHIQKAMEMMTQLSEDLQKKSSFDLNTSQKLNAAAGNIFNATKRKHRNNQHPG